MFSRLVKSDLHDIFWPTVFPPPSLSLALCVWEFFSFATDFMMTHHQIGIQAIFLAVSIY